MRRGVAYLVHNVRVNSALKQVLYDLYKTTVCGTVEGVMPIAWLRLEPPSLDDGFHAAQVSAARAVQEKAEVQLLCWGVWRLWRLWRLWRGWKGWRGCVRANDATLSDSEQHERGNQ